MNEDEKEIKVLEKEKTTNFITKVIISLLMGFLYTIISSLLEGTFNTLSFGTAVIKILIFAIFYIITDFFLNKKKR